MENEVPIRVIAANLKAIFVHKVQGQSLTFNLTLNTSVHIRR
jgi:hypothetical protein